MSQRLRVLQDLGIQIERVAASAPTPAGGGGRRRLLALVVTVALLAIAAAALAASGVLNRGTAVRAGAGDLTHPRSGFGAVRPGGVSGIVAQAPDPAGGPPWGMRVISTTRGLSCLQVGRVVGSRLGVLGQDGLFHDDGRFHPLPAAVNTPAPCSYPDADGNVFTAIELAPLPASGYPLRYILKDRTTHLDAPGGCATATLEPARIPACPVSDERALYFGLLGPRAARIGFTAARGRRTVATGPGGAYLVVSRASQDPKLPGNFMLATPTPEPGADQPIHQITYRDASVCGVSWRTAEQPCPAAGYAPVRLPARRVVAAPVHVFHVVHAPARPGGAGIDDLRVEFTARVAVRSAATSYVLALERPFVGKCLAGGVTATSTTSNIAAGDRITLGLAGQRIGPCPGGVYHGAVYYVLNTGRGPGPQPAPPGHPVPGRPLGGAAGAVGHFSFTEH